MSHKVIIPAAGESITSASIGEWHVSDGEIVSEGQNLVTLETDKVSQELEAEFSGKIQIILPEGEEAEIGAVIATITAVTDEVAAPEQSSAPSVTPVEEVAESAQPVELTVPSFGDSINTASIGDWNFSDGDSVSKGDVLVVLESDKVSSELEAPVDGVLTITIGEGEEVGIGAAIGSIAPASVAKPAQAAAPKVADQPSESPKPVAQPKPVAPKPQKAVVTNDESRTTRKKMSMLRRKISQHLVSAQQTSAILSTFNEVDMSAVMELRKSVQDTFVAKYGVKLGFMSFFVKAVVNALKDVPQINARIDGTDIIENHYFDMGVAIGTDKGLVVPVIRDPDVMSFADIELSIKEYAKKANEGKIELSDLSGGVFTISNGGTYGSLLSTPILNPPQSGILGMHTIQQRPVAINGKVEIRPMMYLALSYDHRLVDGKEAVTFLIKIKEALENPTRLFLEL